MSDFAYSPFPPKADVLGGAVTVDELENLVRDAGKIERGEATADAGNIIADAEKYIRRYCVLPDAAYLTLALWCAATHMAETFDCFPYLALLSPAKRCGKTRLLEILETVCAKPWRGTAPTSAALYRMMKDCPTLLLDEVEGLRNGRSTSETQQAILAVLNAGHRAGATVPRCAGKDQHLEHFPVYGPKAFAAIGSLPDTLSDRSIVLTLQRKKPDQSVERFLFARAKAEAEPIRAGLELVANQYASDVRQAYQACSDLSWLSDRDADLWMPLFALCSVAAPGRVSELRHSAQMLSGVKQEDDTEDSTSLRLLSDIRAVWRQNAPHIASADLLERLRAIEDAPWLEYETTARKVAKWLRPFGVAPRQVRIENGTVKGYVRAEMEPVWSRYLGLGGHLSETEKQPA